MVDQSNDRSADWRRQRRGRVPRPPESAAQDVAVADDSPAEMVASRTLFSFLEPALNTIGSFGAPVVAAGVVALAVGIPLAAFVVSLRLYAFIIIGFGAVLLGVIGLIYLSSVTAAFISRTGRYGVNSLIMLGAFLGIIVVVNFISFSNNRRIDTTATQQFSLASSTRNLLRDLEQPVHAIAFYIDDPAVVTEDQIIRRAKVEDTLSEFSNRSSRFTYEFRDPEIDPEIARSYGVRLLESIVVEGQPGQFDIVQPTDQYYTKLEQDLYTGILVTTGQEQRKVYFLNGHGERNINGVAGDGYASIREELERDNYRVENIRWNPGDTEVSVPDDAALLVIAGPSGELPEAHQTALDNYLKGVNADGTDRREGARVIFLAEPDTPQSFRDFLLDWGILVEQGYILDLDGSVPGNPQTLRVGTYNPEAPQEVVFPRGVPLDVSFMPGAASIQPLEDQSGGRLPIPLARSSTNSYLIDDVNRTEPITEPADQADPSGFFFPAVYLRAVGPIGSPPVTAPPADHQLSGMVVFGDSDFISNGFVNRGSGAAMFLNSANYLLGDFSLVSIRDRQQVFREFNLDQNAFKFVRFSSWFFLPVLMGLAAGVVWWVRR
ncbi:MAG TPA: GldG family protein [Dehalococcoidia bacterium]|nr:GldG family protein [Dehalococcoidia bacterium]